MNKFKKIIERILDPLFLYYFIRRAVLLKKVKLHGKNFMFDGRSTFVTPESMTIGDNVFIGECAHISAEVEIGNNVMFGPRPIILGGNHYFAVKGESVRFLHPQEHENRKLIKIEDEVWCGASVIILDGVCIGMGSIIGAGSVVNKNIPPYVVAVGNPCRPVKKIFDDNTLVEHLIGLGKTPDEAREIQQRREKELNQGNLQNLPAIDNTQSYWKFKKPLFVLKK